jgi:putative heme-binding domain-containing protein
VRCHTVHGHGTAVGPDLSDVAARYPREELVLAVLDPSRRVADEYRTTAFELDDGTFVAGQVQREADGRIELAGTDGVLRTIAASAVVSRRRSTSSVMPAGLARLLSKQEFSDLIAYLSTLRGAPGK